MQLEIEFQHLEEALKLLCHLIVPPHICSTHPNSNGTTNHSENRRESKSERYKSSVVHQADYSHYTALPLRFGGKGVFTKKLFFSEQF